MIYDDMGLLVLKAVRVVEVGSIPYPSTSELCSQIHIYDGISLLALKGVVAVKKRGPFHNFLDLLNCVHKATEIYNGLGLLALNGIVMFDRGSTLYPSPSK